MPLSNPWHLPAVLHFVSAVRPKRILDVGVGMGTYGFMIRQHMDIARERLSPSQWELVIDGLEIFEPYRNPLWEFAYNSIHVGDARKTLPQRGAYDVIVCNDVLEHLPKPEAAALAEEMLKHAPVVIVTTPNFDCPQENWGGNEAERHLCLLRADDLPQVVVKQDTSVTSLFVLSQSAEHIALLERANNGMPRVCLPPRPSLAHRAARKILRKLRLR